MNERINGNNQIKLSRRPILEMSDLRIVSACINTSERDEDFLQQKIKKNSNNNIYNKNKSVKKKLKIKILFFSIKKKTL